MANFLSEIKALAALNLNQTELKKATIENQPNNAGAGTGVEGQLYFDTTLDVLKVWAGGAWTEVGGGVITLASGNTNTITIGGTTANPTVSANTAAVTNGSLNLATGDQIYDFVTGQGYLTAATGVSSIIAGTGIGVSGATGAVTITNTDLGSSQNIFKNFAVSGQSTVVADSNNDTLTLVAGSNVTITTNATSDTITISSSYTDTNTTYALSATTVANGAKAVLTGSDSALSGFNIVGTTNEVEVGIVAGEIKVGLPNDVVIAGNLTVIGTTTTNNVETVSTSNGVIFEGNAADANELTLLAGTLTADRTITLPDATGTVALTSNIGNGTLTVTAGTLMSGGGSFTANQSGNSSVTINHASVSRTNNTSSASPAFGATFTAIDSITTSTEGHVTAVNTKTVTIPSTSSFSAAATISASGTVTHALGEDVIVQLFDAVTKETVYADVVRTSSTVVTITFGQAPTNPIRVLIAKIG